MPLKTQPLPIFTSAFWTRWWNTISENALSATINILCLAIVYFLLRYALRRASEGILTRLLDHSREGSVSEEHRRRLQTMRGLFYNIIGYLLFFLFAILCIKAIGFDILPLLTTASVLGVGIALGAQKLFKDIISGFFLVVDDLFAVGDVVTIGTVTGTVKEIGVRVTRVLDSNGRMHQFPNGDIATVTNLSRHPIEDYIDLALAPTADFHAAREVVNAAGQTLFAEGGHWLTAPPETIGVSGVGATNVTLRVRVVADPIRLTEEQLRVRTALYAALREAGVPFG